MRDRRGRILGALVIASALLVTATFGWIVADVVWHGAAVLSWDFLVEPVRDAGRSGGIGPIIVSTLAILAVSLLTAVPIGVATAVFLAEVTRSQGALGAFVRRSLDILAGIPSIVFGLFGNIFFAKVLGLGFSIIAGGLTLACMVLPLFIRTTEEAIRAVPLEWRQGAAALGLSRTTTLCRVLLPAAIPGIIAGLVLGIGRALAETAALIFTSGYVDRMPESLFDSGRALSVHIYDLAMNVPGGNRNAYGSALVLIALLFAVQSIASWIVRGSLGGRFRSDEIRL